MMKDLSFEISIPVSFRFSMQGRIEGFFLSRPFRHLAPTLELSVTKNNKEYTIDITNDEM